MTYYDIRIEYTDSDSDKSWATSDTLDLPVTSLDVAKENLQRIKQHAKFYNQRTGYSLTPKKHERPEFCLEKDNGIILKIDDERTHTILNPFWIGCMTHPDRASIIEVDPEEEMSFDFASCY